jgi:hypothetical protein
MTGTGRCAEVRLSLGVYVLGAAEPAERTLVRLHLARCRECRDELAALAGLPGLLRRVPLDEAERIFPDEGEPAGQTSAPGGSVLDGLLGRTARTRRTRRWLAVAAAAATIVIAAGSGVAAGGGFGLDENSHTAQVVWETFTAHNDVTQASATVRYTPAPWGARVEVRTSGIAPGTPCQLRVIASGGQRRIAGNWTVVRGEYSMWIPASTSFPASKVVGFTVLSGGKALVNVPAIDS